ncbi:MAG: PilW family protein [Methylococcales bacterium]|nr:PilW family protein [Methylococcales bacterium]
MKTFRTNSPQRGFTLIELMIAMLIGVFLMAGVIQIFISAKQAYRLQENLSRLQENGRFSMDFLTKGIRMAGYMGCSSSAKSTTVMVDPTKISVASLSLKAISGLDNVANNWSAKACGTNECVAGTDVINFMTSGSCGGKLVGNMSSDNANIQIDANNTCDVEKDEVVIISDCSSSDVFGASSASSGDGKQTIAHANNINIANKLSKAYAEDAEIFSPKLMSYFIRSGTGGVPALWSFDSTDAGSTPQELIEGIENMQVLYGVDTDVTRDYVPNYYVDASKVPATITGTTDEGWTRVVSVRINLLAVTIDNNLTDSPQSYFYNGTTTAPPQIPVLKTDTSQYCQGYTGTLPSTCRLANDLRIHRVFSSTIAVRNRLP